MTATIPLDAPKSASYYGLSRADVIDLLPRPLGRVLDVGCGEGGVAAPLRRAGATVITGIEILPGPAAEAARVYDQVRVGDALEQAQTLDGPFDTVLCYDVLEHLYDPQALLIALRDRTNPRGHLHVSVPNASHVSLLRDLIVSGSFNYQPYGHRDATHIRWFTRKDIVGVVRDAGWHVLGTTPSTLHRPSRTLHRLSRGRSTEFLAGQWYVLAQRL